VTSLDDGLGTRFDVPDKNKENGSKVMAKPDFGSAFIESDFTQRLSKERVGGNCEFGEEVILHPSLIGRALPIDNAFFEYLKSLTPAAVDMEIRSLLSIEHLEQFLKALIGRLRSHRDFEAIQAVLSVCLTVHSDLFIANEELGDVLRQLLVEQKKESERLMNLVNYNLGTMSFLRGA